MPAEYKGRSWDIGEEGEYVLSRSCLDSASVYVIGSQPFFGTRNLISWKTIFPWIGDRDWFPDGSSALRLSCTLFLLLFYQFHLK